MRPTWVEIDLNALKSNFLRVKEIVGEGVGVLSIVKADAYGHGAIRVGKTLVDAGTDMLGVATLEEALELRESGIGVPMFILGGIHPDEAQEVIKCNFIPALFSLESASALSEASRKLGKRAKYHLKLDTGMSRLGVGFDDICNFLNELSTLEGLEMQGVFTHLADADGASRDFTLRQIGLFREALELLRVAGFRALYVHTANSAAIERFPESHNNLVRPGIMLYGASGGININSGINSRLKPVMKFKTKIIQIKRLRKGTPVSYGGTFVTSGLTLIAVLPVGYADGYARSLSNRAEVALCGKGAPVVGSVCMDLTVIDVTDVPGAKVGDEVVLFGDSGVPVEDVAGWANTISYEVLSLIGNRVPRVYI